MTLLIALMLLSHMDQFTPFNVLCVFGVWVAHLCTK